jgi:class 3 adenylate cyclase
VGDRVTHVVWLESSAGAKTPIRGACSIGRARGNDLVIVDNRVSRSHAMIHSPAPGEFWLVDLHSANGTQVNGRRVARSVRLKDQDLLEVGRHTFVFREDRTANVAQPDDGTVTSVDEGKTLTCWLLVADIEGHTRLLQELPTEDVATLTGDWLNTCREIVDQNDGVTNKFLGDGFFTYWPMLDDGTTAAVARTITAMKSLQPKKSPPFRIAVHFGKVFRGGGPSGEENLMGYEVNFAFRMEKLAKELNVPCLLSEAAHEAFKGALSGRLAGRRPVASFDGDYAFYSA